MVIEYVGELVRPAVADARERRCYDSLVGAGTYVFRLNAARGVDATRAGNLAHLINHSSAPCCHSRTITMRCPATGARTDHAVSCASRDTAVGEELSYDYRYDGAEKRRCNCGAASCRGWVNSKVAGSPRRPADGSMWVLARELERVQPAAAAGAFCRGQQPSDRPSSLKRLQL